MTLNTKAFFFLSGLSLSLNTACFGPSHPVPQPPTIARYTSEWTATGHTSMCQDGDFNGKYVLNPGFGVGGREITTFPDGSKMYTVYETYNVKMEIPPNIFRSFKTTITTKKLNRYDFYVNDEDIIIKCIPTTTELSQSTKIN